MKKLLKKIQFYWMLWRNNFEKHPITSVQVDEQLFKIRDTLSFNKTCYIEATDRMYMTCDKETINSIISFIPVKYQSYVREEHDCLKWDTKLLDSIGNLINIEDIEINDYVFGKDGKLKRVLDKIDKGVLPTRKVLLNNGTELIATPDHKFILEDNKEVRLSELKIGDRLKKIDKLNFEKYEEDNEDYWKLKDQIRILYRILGKSSSYRGYAPTKTQFGTNLIWRICPRLLKDRGLIVKGIIDNGEEQVYDITIEDHEIYLPENDCVVHNCENFAIEFKAICNRLLPYLPVGYCHVVRSDGVKHAANFIIYVTKSGSLTFSFLEPQTGKISFYNWKPYLMIV